MPRDRSTDPSEFSRISYCRQRRSFRQHGQDVVQQLIERSRVRRIHEIDLNLVDDRFNRRHVGLLIQIFHHVQERLEARFRPDELVKFEFPVTKTFLLTIEDRQALETLFLGEQPLVGALRRELRHRRL